MSEASKRVTISLSTTPRRVEKILPTLTSLLQQTRPADSIILNIPTYCSRLNQQLDFIPEYLFDLVKDTQLEIQLTDDYGPATKFIPTCQSINRSENHFLIWLDDDIIYTNSLVEELINNCPKNTAIATTGFVLLPNHHKMILRHMHEVDIVEGWGGVCCRTSDIPENIAALWKIKPYSEMSFHEKCLWNSDDYVMSRALQSHGIKTLVCCNSKLNRFMNKPLEYGLQSDALQKNKETNGHYIAYGALEKPRSFSKLLNSLKTRE